MSLQRAETPAKIIKFAPRQARQPSAAANYRHGAVYALVAAALLALQVPFSALAARSLSASDFVGVTQAALLASVPLLIARRESRRDFAAILTTPAHWPKILALFAIGLGGLALYDVGLSSAHPIITAAVLNLSPFWAALVARVVSGKRPPISPFLFFGCFFVAFLGAMVIGWSQIGTDNSALVRQVIESALHSHWIFALPIPIFFALSGTLVYVWFSRYDESAAIAANFLVSAIVLIPAAVWLAHGGGPAPLSGAAAPAVLLLFIGTLASSAAGRVFYQEALSATDNDNGFVTMFFLSIPAVSALVSWPLSRWIVTLRFTPSPLFFGGMTLVIAPLLLFSLVCWRARPPVR